MKLMFNLKIATISHRSIFCNGKYTTLTDFKFRKTRTAIRVCSHWAITKSKTKSQFANCWIFRKSTHFHHMASNIQFTQCIRIIMTTFFSFFNVNENRSNKFWLTNQTLSHEWKFCTSIDMQAKWTNVTNKDQIIKRTHEIQLEKTFWGTIRNFCLQKSN